MNINKLEALAKVATPGAWDLTADQFSHIVIDLYGNEIHVGDNEATARLIAAANPETILQLISLVREMGEALESCAVAFADDEELHDTLTKYKELTK